MPPRSDTAEDTPTRGGAGQHAALLHLQTRAYPLGDLELPALDGERVLADGTRIADGRLASVVYREQPCYELTDLRGFGHVVATGDIEVVWRRARIVAGTLLVTTALSHMRDLTRISLHELADVDARIHRQLCATEATAVAGLRRQLADAGILEHPNHHPAIAPIATTDDPSRYNCHLLTTGISAWDDGTQEALPGARCRLLLSYTFAWDMAADATPSAVLDELEPADITIAQRVVLAAARARAIAVLEQLATDRTDPAPVDAFRAELDRTRALYHRLDHYRYDAAQRARSTHLAARHAMGLDDVHARTEHLLAQVSDSLAAANQARSLRFERTLSKVVGSLTIVTAGAFGLDLMDFLRAGQPLSVAGRVATIGALIAVSVLALAWLFSIGRSRR